MNNTDQIITTSITALKQQLEIANNKLVAAKWEVKRIEKALKAFEAQLNAEPEQTSGNQATQSQA